MALLHMVDGVVLEMSPEEEADFTARQAAAAAEAAKALVPATVSSFQAFAALDAIPLTTDQLSALSSTQIAGLQSTTLLGLAAAEVAALGGTALLAWNKAQEFDRDSPTIAMLAGKLGLTSDQLDQLFIQAAQIRA